MSLVNYYASSDDDNSSNEEETEETLDRAEFKVGIADQPTPSMFYTLPAPASLQIIEPEEMDIKYPITSAAASSSTSSHGLLNLPAPKKRSNQPIKITAPALPETNSDDEEDEPSTKKAKPAKTNLNRDHHSLGSPVNSVASTRGVTSGHNHLAARKHTGLAGFFAMLPKPRNASLKETNRRLLPYTLTKKPASSKPVQSPATKPSPSQPASVKGKPAGPTTTTCGSDDDDDAETSSFFSFGEKPSVSLSIPAVVSKLPAADLNKFKLLVTSSSPEPGEGKQTSLAKPQSSTTTGQSTVNPGRPGVDSTAPLDLEPSSTQDSPLSFKPSDPPSGQDAPLSFSKPMRPSTQYSYPPAGQYAESQMYAAPYGYDYTQYNQPYQETDPPAFGDGQAGSSVEGQGSEKLSDLAGDKEFQRLMGKRNVGRESINVVDITADEQIGPTNHLDWMKKNLTEEKEYRAKLRKEQLPSGQQKRKHQITFLAHQAKERELELKNQWANNRQTRKDTQMKYGF